MDSPVKIKKEVFHLCLPLFSGKSYLTLELTFDIEFCLVPHRIFLFSTVIWMYYRNIQCFTMAMPFNVILILYVIPCELSCDFSKLTILYIGL